MERLDAVALGMQQAAEVGVALGLGQRRPARIVFAAMPNGFGKIRQSDCALPCHRQSPRQQAQRYAISRFVRLAYRLAKVVDRSAAKDLAARAHGC
jgi:hypothetical protein